MSFEGFLRLGLQSITAPREVARLLLSLKLPAEVLVLGLALTVVLNALLFSLSLIITPVPELAGLMSSPLAVMAMRTVVLLVLIASFTGLGRALGGAGSLADLTLVMIWLQALGVAAQAVLVLLGPLAPEVTALLAFAASAVGAWISAGFIDEAHGFNNGLKAVAVLIFGAVLAAVGLSLFLSLIGFDTREITGYV